MAPVSSKLPSVLSLSSSTETESSPEREAVPGALGVREELSLAWQQKVFSRDEFRSFANANEEDFESPMNKKSDTYQTFFLSYDLNLCISRISHVVHGMF